jgi:hypothetical protein
LAADRTRGCVKRNQGILASDVAMSSLYRLAMTDDVVNFGSEIQLAVIDAVLESHEKQRFQCYYIATEDTHAHILIGWRDERLWRTLRAILKSSLSRALNKSFRRREWFAEGTSRKRLKNRTHFDYLISKYLPKHKGWKWSPERGKFR